MLVKAPLPCVGPDVAKSQRAGDCGNYQGGVRQARQVDEPDAIPTQVDNRSRSLYRQSCLAAAAWSCEREQAHVTALQQLHDLCDVAFAADETCRLDRQGSLVEDRHGGGG